MHRPIPSLAVLVGCIGLVADELRWRNGDMMPGTLLEAEAGQVRWSSPQWPEPWILEAGSLEAVEFDGPTSTHGGTWRILTHAGDSLLADLEGADDLEFHIGSPILETRRIRREAVRMMERLENPDRIFLAGSYRDWLESDRGPILDLRYRIYKLGEGWDVEGEIPVFADMEPIAEGSLPNGRIDFGVVSFEGPRAVVFEGEIEMLDTATYFINMRTSTYEDDVVNWARLWIGERSLDMDRRGNDRYHVVSSDLSHISGRQLLRFEYIGDSGEQLIHPGLRPVETGGTYIGPDDFAAIHRFHLSESNIHVLEDEIGETYNGPGNPYSLASMGTERMPGWQAGSDGHLKTIVGNASVIRSVVIPESFDLEVELSSGSSPRFMLGLGSTIEVAKSFDTFRLETWDEALVATRDDSFKTLRILEEDDRELRFRLHYNGADRLLQVFDFDGTLLARWDGVRIDPGVSGICLINEGDDLVVRRICLTRRDGGPVFTGFDQPWVRLLGGEILRGSLRHDPATGSWSVAFGEESRALDPDQVERVVHPSREMTPMPSDVVLTDGRGTRIKGRLQEVTDDALILVTDLSETPVACSRDGLESLLFLSSGYQRSIPDSELKIGTFAFQGNLELKEGEDPLWWLPEGALEPQPLTSRIIGRIERRHPVSGAEDHPHRIRLYGNMSLPVRSISLDEDHLEFETFLLGRRTIESRHLRAIELDRNTVRLNPQDPDADREPDPRPEVFEAMRIDVQPGVRFPSGLPDEGDVRKRVEQALRIPRFQRGDPPTHLVVARNGDVERGRLIAIDEDSLRLRSRLREKTLERDLVRQVVRIVDPEKSDEVNRIRILLHDDMLLGGESVSSDGKKLLLQSRVLGRCEIPLEMVRELTLGEFETSRHPDPYRDWVVKPTGPGEIE